MTKRQRDTRLTREQLEAGDYGSEDEPDNQNKGLDMATIQAIQNRKIVRVKRHNPSTGEVKSEDITKPATFKLAGKLGTSVSSTASTTASKPTFAFTPAAAKTEAPKEEKPQEAKKFTVASGGSFGGVDLSKKPSSGGLFGSAAPAKPLFGAPASNVEPKFKPIGGGTFAGKTLPEPAKVEQKPVESGSLFGAPVTKQASGGSLFGNLNTIKPAAEPEKKSGSLFGSTVPSSDGTQKFGLFGATKPAEIEKKPSGGLFGATTTPAAPGSLFSAPAASSGGLFGSKPPEGGSLFGGAPAGSGGGLFGQATQGSSLFKFAPPPKKEDVNDDSDGEVENDGEKSPPIYQDGNAKTDFKGGVQAVQPSPYTKLFDKRVNTFKIVKPDDQKRKITECDVAIETADVAGKPVFLVVVRQAKKVLIQGTLNAKVSRCRAVPEKSAKNQLKIAIQMTIDSQVEVDGKKITQKKVVFPYCCINFCRQEEMQSYETEFTKAVEALKAQK